MIKLIEREDLRKVVKRIKVWRERKDRKEERERGKNLFIACASCIRIPVRPRSAVIIL